MMFYPKTKRYLYLKKNVKKAQGIIFLEVKMGNAGVTFLRKIKRSTRINVLKHERIHDLHFYANIRKRETTIFETDAHR